MVKGVHESILEDKYRNVIPPGQLICTLVESLDTQFGIIKNYGCVEKYCQNLTAR